MDGSMDEYWMDIDGSIVQDEGGDKRETFVLWLLQDALVTDVYTVRIYAYFSTLVLLLCEI